MQDKPISVSFRKTGTLCFLIMVGSVMYAFGQRHKVISAYNHNQEGEFLEAKTFIDSAAKHPKTSQKAKTWYYRGNTYLGILQSKKDKYKEVRQKDPIGIAYHSAHSYLKAKELDERGRYDKELEQRLRVTKNYLLNFGVKAYNSRDHEGAFKAFNEAVEVGKALGNPEKDTMAYYNAGLSAERIGKNEVAIQYFKKCIELDYRGPKVYILLAQVLEKMGEKEKAYQAIRDGRKDYPDNNRLILKELNYYLEKKNFQKAKENLELAIEKEPDNPVLHFSLGTVYDNLYQRSGEDSVKIGGKDSSLFMKAEGQYKKAISIDSNYHNAFYNLGALYYNRGAEVMNKANTLKDQAKYEEELNNAKEDLKKALPYLKKAHELKPNDRQTLISLRNLYARLGNEKKSKEMQEELDN